MVKIESIEYLLELPDITIEKKNKKIGRIIIIIEYGLLVELDQQMTKLKLMMVM
jgi:nitrate reductase NapAB chaperone NapD